MAYLSIHPQLTDMLEVAQLKLNQNPSQGQNMRNTSMFHWE